VRQQSVLEVEDLPVAGLDGAQQAVQREIVERLYAAIRQLPKTDAALVLLNLDDLIKSGCFVMCTGGVCCLSPFRAWLSLGKLPGRSGRAAGGWLSPYQK
jgi:hypothetical protein